MSINDKAQNSTTVMDRLIAEAAVLAGGTHPCAVLGHVWNHTGGSNCGCRDGHCSVPVHECEACGEHDYGDNEEADDIRRKCQERRSIQYDRECVSLLR